MKVDRDQVIEHLKAELFLASETIIELAPRNVTDLLGSYRQLNDSKQLPAWKKKVVDVLVDKVTGELERLHKVDERAEIRCPCCHHGFYSAGHENFRFAWELRQHLNGEHHHNRCKVLRAAFYVADAYAENVLP